MASGDRGKEAESAVRGPGLSSEALGAGVWLYSE